MVGALHKILGVGILLKMAPIVVTGGTGNTADLNIINLQRKIRT